MKIRTASKMMWPLGPSGALWPRGDGQSGKRVYELLEVESMWMGIQQALGIATWPQRLAKRKFREQYADESISWTRLSADEPDRYVVGVYYGGTRPPRFLFYAVDKQTYEVALVEDDTPYRPRLWR